MLCYWGYGMRMDFGKKLDELKGSQLFMGRVVLPSMVGLFCLIGTMDAYGFAGFPLAKKLFLMAGIGAILLILAVSSYRASNRRFEIYQRGAVFHSDEGERMIPYSSIDRFEWEDEDVQFLSIRICCRHCHIVDKDNARVASVNSREFAKMNAKMAKLESKLHLR